MIQQNGFVFFRDLDNIPVCLQRVFLGKIPISLSISCVVERLGWLTERPPQIEIVA